MTAEIHKRCHVTCFLHNCIIRARVDREALSLLSSPPPSFHPPQHNKSGRSQFGWLSAEWGEEKKTEMLLLVCSMWRRYCARERERSGRLGTNSLSIRAAGVKPWRMCHCLLRVSCGKRLLKCIDKGKGGWCAWSLVRSLCRWGAVHKTVATGQVQPCVAICTDGGGGGGVGWGKSTCCYRNPSCFGFGVGVHACAMGEGFGAVRILFVMVQRQQQHPPHPRPVSPPPHPAPSLLVLLTGVYVKALRKTTTLNCTQPSGSKPAEVDGAACVCTRVLMFADLTVNPPPQERCLWAAALAVSNVCALICFTTRTHGVDWFVLGQRLRQRGSWAQRSGEGIQGGNQEELLSCKAGLVGFYYY